MSDDGMKKTQRERDDLVSQSTESKIEREVRSLSVAVAVVEEVLVWTGETGTLRAGGTAFYNPLPDGRLRVFTGSFGLPGWSYKHPGSPPDAGHDDISAVRCSA